MFICSFRCIAHFKDFERRRGSALSQQRELLVKIHAFRALALRARTAHIVTRRVEIWIIEAYHEPTVKDQIQAQIRVADPWDYGSWTQLSCTLRLTWTAFKDEGGSKTLFVVGRIVTAAGGGRADRHSRYVAVEHQSSVQREYVVVVSDW